MFLKTLLASILILLLSTSIANTQQPQLKIDPAMKQPIITLSHICFPTAAVLETWRENGEFVSYIANVRPTPKNPPGQIIVTTNKENGEYTLLFSVQTPKVEMTCVLLHGKNFVKVD